MGGQTLLVMLFLLRFFGHLAKLCSISHCRNKKRDNSKSKIKNYIDKESFELYINSPLHYKAINILCQE